jgi:hypothetical protein
MSAESDCEDDTYDYGSLEDSEEKETPEFFLVPDGSGGLSEVFFASLSLEAFAAFDLKTDIGFLYALLCLDGFMEWSATEMGAAMSPCSRMVLLLQCIAVLVADGISTPFRKFAKIYMFVSACCEWSECNTSFLEMSKDSPKTFSKIDMKKATNASNKIAAAFKCSRDDMRLVASLPGVFDCLLNRPALAIFPHDEKLESSLASWTAIMENLSIITNSCIIKNYALSEGYLLQTPLLAESVSVERDFVRTEMDNVVVKPVKQGANARKKAAKKNAGQVSNGSKGGTKSGSVGLGQ